MRTRVDKRMEEIHFILEVFNRKCERWKEVIKGLRLEKRNYEKAKLRDFICQGRQERRDQQKERRGMIIHSFKKNKTDGSFQMCHLLGKKSREGEQRGRKGRK